MKVVKKKWAVPVAALILTLSIAGAAFAATAAPGSTATTVAPQNGTYCGGERGWGGQRSDETALSGDELTKVKDAALAKIGTDATVVRAETDADGNAKYEVHAIKADGTHVTVYLDQNYVVTSVETCDGPNGEGTVGRRGMMRGNESPLTGATLTAVQNAALAAVGSGSTLVWATTEDDNANSNVKYEAMVKKADGTCVIVYLDANYKVVEQVSAPQGGGRHGRGPGGEGRGCRGTTPQGTTPSTGTSTTGGTISYQ
jgi:uncharacterized membrane protein YkoI